MIIFCNYSEFPFLTPEVKLVIMINQLGFIMIKLFFSFQARSCATGATEGYRSTAVFQQCPKDKSRT